MEKGRASKALKLGRKLTSKTQQQLSMETFLSREAFCQQENEAYKVQPDVTKHFINKYNNPWVAMEAANEYIGWGVTRLDGRAADLHRSSVKDKLLEELEEAIEAIKKVKTSLNPDMIQSFERQDVERSVQEIIDATKASITWVAIVCDEYGLSWSEEWDKNQTKLKAKQFVRS
ncbi:XRE family transcriptional regulator [Aquibacillus rhizosphaerae]|uniref:XRE family transcriptional regulator n=1 Tax=Aquibacillus rhizosphaerae TaxID=3051431 RepID=A0ABT7LDY0_9BACI|nr:XRE family transcriptional regulator [Aquibacillus sp. LR5S19]MDL4842800.1 XRE family transcriptional regulator [Aquibacillus sp. LR5S19]